VKKLIQVVVAAAGILLAPLALAAFVETYTPEGINPAQYTVLGGDTPDLVYSNIINADNADLATVADNGGHELVFLGLHTAFELVEGNLVNTDQVTVNLDKVGTGSTTGSVSLVLSAATGVEWLINIGAGVQLENIYLFSPNPTDRANTSTTIAGGSPNVVVSPADICGYELPSVGSCITEHILGTTDRFGLDFNDFLGDLGTALNVTNFNGTYYANRFDIAVDAAVIPLPAASVLFMSGLGLMALFSRRN